MTNDFPPLTPHPAGEQPMVAIPLLPGDVAVDTFAGRVHVEWDSDGAVTPLGQLPFFIDLLKAGGLFDGWVADCPLAYRSPNAPKKRDVLGTVMLSILAGHWRYAHMTALRGDVVLPELQGIDRVVSEDAVRRALKNMDEDKATEWCIRHLDYCTSAALGEPWILDVDTTVKLLYGHQEGAEIGYNPHKPGRPPHTYHTYMAANLRLVLEVDVKAGNEHTSRRLIPMAHYVTSPVKTAGTRTLAGRFAIEIPVRSPRFRLSWSPWGEIRRTNPSYRWSATASISPDYAARLADVA